MRRPLACLSVGLHRVALCALPSAAALLLSPSVHAQTGAPAARPPAKPAGPSATVRKPAPRPASPREALRREAGGLALAITTVEAITEAQVELASRVLTGTADCEFEQQVSVQAVSGQPGLFSVGFKGQRYTMVPEETRTGAVRLEDKRAGVVWLQIPTKSMLMNSRLGRRLVDACQHSEQRVAVNAVVDAANSLGIAADSAAAPASGAAPAMAGPAAPAASR